MWNSFLCLWVRLLEKFTKQGDPSISTPSYLAGTTQQKSKEQATKSGSAKTTIKRKSTSSKELDAVGMMVENKWSTQIPNLLMPVIDTLERRQLVVIRCMYLNHTAHDPRTINGTAQVESKARAVLKDVGMAGLIAQPMN